MSTVTVPSKKKSSNSGMWWGLVLLILVVVVLWQQGAIKQLPVVTVPDDGVPQIQLVEAPVVADNSASVVVGDCNTTSSLAMVTFNQATGGLQGSCLQKTGVHADKVYLDPSFVVFVESGTEEFSNVVGGVADAVFQVLVTNNPRLLNRSPDKESARRYYVTSAVALNTEIGQDANGQYLQMPDVIILANVPQQVAVEDWPKSVTLPATDTAGNGVVTFTPLSTESGSVQPVESVQVEIPVVEFVQIGNTGVSVQVQPVGQGVQSSSIPQIYQGGNVAVPPSQSLNSTVISAEPGILGFVNPMLEALREGANETNNSPSAGWNTP